MKKFTLITGATSGIGWELSKVFAENGHNLILTGRNERKLNELKDELSKSVEVHIMAGDLSYEEFIHNIKLYADKKNISVQYLVNNAGVGSFGEFIDIDSETDLNMIDINIRALTYLCKLFLPDMKKNNDGGIMNICSTAAFSPGPYMAVYYATKSYVLSLTEALKGEMHGTDVKVSAVCPGPTQTKFQARAKVKKAEFAKKALMSPENVAYTAYKGFMKGKLHIVPGIGNKILVWGSRFVPISILNSIIRRVNGN